MNQLNTATMKCSYKRQNTVDARSSVEDDDLLLSPIERLELATLRATQYIHKYVKVNVSGKVVETCVCVLSRHPETILGHPIKRKRYWDEKHKEYFIDAHPTCFEAIFQFFQTDKIKRPFEVPLDTFIEQLELYEISPAVIDLYKYSEGILLEEELEEPEGSDTKKMLWSVLEMPSSSPGARIMALMSIVLITLSLFLFCIETLPRYKDIHCKDSYDFNYETGNVTLRRTPNFANEFFLLETVCVLFFTIEIVLRMYCTANIKNFVRSPMNIIDFSSNIPYYVSLTVAIVTQSCEIGNRSMVLKVLRIFRVFRIFKFSKHSKILRIWTEALKASKNEFLVFMCFMAISGTLFASLLYSAEQFDQKSQIRNIPDGIWWAVASMTTVGYGDVVPTSMWGKIIAAACVIVGVIAVALPTPIIVANFNRFYKNITGRGHDDVRAK